VSAARTILEFLAFAEGVKRELRHSWLSDGRRESVAEHSWQMALMAIVVHPHLEAPVDLCRALKMILVHDLAEAETGDVPVFETGARKAAKPARERAAMEAVRARLGDPAGQEIHDLWLDYETTASNEAKLARALNHLEVQIQHNLADLATWEPVEYALVYTKMDASCAFDPLLADLCQAVKAEAEAKMAAGGVDVEAVKRRAEPPPRR
jgi:putative hydrolase of HD superfamily